MNGYLPLKIYLLVATAKFLLFAFRNAYLASKKGLDIVGAVSTALSNATSDKQSTQQVLIQSDDTSVLSKFKDTPSYKRVLFIEDKIGDTPRQTVDEIKKFADAVNLPKTSVITVSNSLLTGMTNIVKELKEANITVFVHALKNEYASLAFDYWSDPYVEIATYAVTAQVDGIVTDFPATASRYMKSPCSDPNRNPTILPAQAGDLLKTVPAELLPPAEAPLPPLEAAKVVDPPLPVVVKSAIDKPAAPAPGPASSARANVAANLGLFLVINLMVAFLAIGL